MAAAKKPTAAVENAATRNDPPNTGEVRRLLVRSRVEGFRRAGRAWSTQETEVDADEFTADQVEQLLAEPELTVIAVSDE